MRGTSLIALALLTAGAFGQDEAETPEALAREDVYASIDRAVGYLVENQEDDGSWGTSAPECLFEIGFALETYYGWQVSAHGLAALALASVPETPERRLALERAVDWLTTVRIPTRGADWDQDHVWSALYGFQAAVELMEDPRFAGTARGEALRVRAESFLEVLRSYQAASGGWAYYDDPPYDVVPTWATSFCTALILPSLVRAREAGLPVEDRMIERAIRYVRRCALPNGAYTYDLTPVPRISGVEHINKVEGSLGRIQVCNWALVECGVEQVTEEVVRRGVEAFFEHRGFLDHVRTRPIPHEGFHANAGYFYFFGHYYLALAIELLPEEEQEGWHAKLRPHFVKTQWASGATSDFLDAQYLINASTAYLILGLQAGLEPETSAEEEGLDR